MVLKKNLFSVSTNASVLKHLTVFYSIALKSSIFERKVGCLIVLFGLKTILPPITVEILKLTVKITRKRLTISIFRHENCSVKFGRLITACTRSSRFFMQSSRMFESDISMFNVTLLFRVFSSFKIVICFKCYHDRM